MRNLKSIFVISAFLLIILAILLIFTQTSENKKAENIQSTKNQLNKNLISEKKPIKIQNGDIVFQISFSGQGKAIQLATHSDYTHCGIIFIENGKHFVLEAVQPVKITPLQNWIASGQNAHFVIKRLKNNTQVLNPENLRKMKNYGQKAIGKNYDAYFAWSDERLYCSELVWKIYQIGTGLEVGILQKLKEFDLTSTEVKQKLYERYGNNIPYQEKVISPAAIFESNLLEEVQSNPK